MAAASPLDKIRALVASQGLTAVTPQAPENVQRLQNTKPPADTQGSKEIYINDVAGRDRLIRSQFHSQVMQKAAVSVRMRGEYVPPGQEPPPGIKKLHLFVTGSDEAISEAERIVQEAVRQAAMPRPSSMPPIPHMPPQPMGPLMGAPVPTPIGVAGTPGPPPTVLGSFRVPPVGAGPSMPPGPPRHKMVNTAMLPDKWDLPDDLTLPRGENSRTVTQQGQSFSQAKIFLDMDPRPGFDVKAKIEGENRSHLNHVQNLTGAKVYLRGRGSGFIEPVSGKIAFERMYLYISHPEEKCSQLAVDLCKDLVAVVQNDYATDFGRTEKQQEWHVPMHIRKFIDSNDTVTAYPAQLGLVYKTQDEDTRDDTDDGPEKKRRKFIESKPVMTN